MAKLHKLYIDQRGAKWFARTVKELCMKIGRTKARKMYIDGVDGKSYHTGYVIGDHWCTCYTPMRKEV